MAKIHNQEKIVIEALAYSNDSGLGKVTRLFLEHLYSLLKNHNVILITREKNIPDLPENWIHKMVSAKPFRVWKNIWFPLLLFKLRPNIVICLGQTLPPLRPKAIYHIHIADVGPLENLGFQTSKFDSKNKMILNKMILMADVIWTISDFTKSRIEFFFPNKKNIYVIQPFYQVNNSIQSDKSSLLKKFTSGKIPYILSLGNLEPRKNYTQLIGGFSELSSGLNTNLQLVIVGHKAWGYEEIIQAVENSPFSKKIHVLGFVTEEEKWEWIKNCQFYVSTSNYEGWGFPLFEAISLLKPCMYNIKTSQNEFAQGFALGYHPEDQFEFANHLHTLATSEPQRINMAQKIENNFINSFISVEESIKKALEAPLKIL